MGLFDNILAEAQNKLASAQTDVQKYLLDKVAEPLVKIGVLPSGNLSQAQLAAGLRGTPAPIAPPQAAPASIARSEGSGFGSDFSLPAGLSLPIIAGIGLLAFLAFRKKG